MFDNNKLSSILKIIFSAVRWMLGIFFALLTLGNGFHFSSLFLLGAALLILPLNFIQYIFDKINVKTSVVITLSLVLFLVGLFTVPSVEIEEPITDETSQNIVIDNDTTPNKPVTPTDKPTTTTKKPNTITTPKQSSTTTKKPTVTTTSAQKTTTTPKPTTTQAKPTTQTTPVVTTKPTVTTTQTKEEMVWIPKTGQKYHLDPVCGNMKNPREVPLNYAINRGYEPCSKCYYFLP